MKVRSFTLSNATYLPAMQGPGVRAKLSEIAEQIAKQAEVIAGSEDIDGEVWTDEGTRPKGRPYARVATDAVDQERGTDTVEKRRIMARAAEAVTGQSATSNSRS